MFRYAIPVSTVVLVLVTVASMGFIYGLQADSRAEATISDQADTHVTVEELRNQPATEQTAIQRLNRRLFGEPPRWSLRFRAAFTSTLLSLAFTLVDGVSLFAYQNQGWISEAWAVPLLKGVMYAVLGAALLVHAGYVWRRFNGVIS